MENSARQHKGCLYLSVLKAGHYPETYRWSSLNKVGRPQYTPTEKYWNSCKLKELELKIFKIQATIHSN
jgi:hypothetical protein